jgi:acyl-coenzyme A synthetase/AMP-(fatty) acid ligase
LPFHILSTWIDVINVAGHRLSTAEVESALILHPGVAEAAVIGTADELTGQAVHAFVTLKPYVISISSFAAARFVLLECLRRPTTLIHVRNMRMVSVIH